MSRWITPLRNCLELAMVASASTSPKNRKVWWKAKHFYFPHGHCFCHCSNHWGWGLQKGLIIMWRWSDDDDEDDNHTVDFHCHQDDNNADDDENNGDDGNDDHEPWNASQRVARRPLKPRSPAQPPRSASNDHHFDHNLITIVMMVLINTVLMINITLSPFWSWSPYW